MSSDTNPIQTFQTAPVLMQRHSHFSHGNTALQEAWEDTGTSVRSQSDDDEKKPSNVSKWGVGWQTRFVMAGAYLLASNIISSVFGIVLNFGLGIAFCQYLWRVLRVSAMKVSTIENLFLLRSNPIVIFRADFKAAPLLFLLAILMWSIQIAVNFPTGAMTIAVAEKIRFDEVLVQTFDPSYVGDGSYADANKYFMLGSLDIVNGSLGSANLYHDALVQLAILTMMTGDQPFWFTPDCIENCSYTIQFPGPWLECNASTEITYLNTYDFPDGMFNMYEGRYNTPFEHDEMGASAKGLPFTFDTVTYSPIAANIDETTLYGPTNRTGHEGLIGAKKNMMSCELWRADYTLAVNYTNGFQVLSSSAQKVDILQPSLWRSVHGIADENTTHLRWDTNDTEWYRDINLGSIAEAVIKPLRGNYTSAISISGPFNETTPVTFSNNTNNAVFNPPLDGEGNLWSHNIDFVPKVELPNGRGLVASK
ncbi:hypothetical protein NHQ30_006855 [Ciborinia camelliae]|nr:hypothetical protein NHQ30_006855 [Ciborinia camelliae]